MVPPGTFRRSPSPAGICITRPLGGGDDGDAGDDLLHPRSNPPRSPSDGGAGAGGMRSRPDGGVVLPTGERIAVEVELHAKAAERLGAKFTWYRDAARYAEVRWLVPAAGVEESLWEAIAAVDPKTEPMAVERLPAGLLRYAGG
jgi:hypothetical protein